MFRDSLNDKIGNTIIYLIDKIGILYLTKAIKLLYITDEISIKETGVPFTWLDYKAWKMGPVPEDIYFELRYKQRCLDEHCNISISKYVDVQIEANPVSPDRDAYKLLKSKPFSEDEFSEYEIDLLNRVISRYGGKSANELIDILHLEGTLWDKVVKENNLKIYFDLQNETSPVVIPLIELIKEDGLKQLAYKSAFTSLSLNSQLVC